MTSNALLALGLTLAILFPINRTALIKAHKKIAAEKLAPFKVESALEGEVFVWQAAKQGEEPIVVEAVQNVHLEYYLGTPKKTPYGTVFFNPGNEYDARLLANQQAGETKYPMFWRSYSIEGGERSQYREELLMHSPFRTVYEKPSEFLAPFFMKQYEVTNGEYRQFVEAVQAAAQVKSITAEELKNPLYTYYNEAGEPQSVRVVPDTNAWKRLQGSDLFSTTYYQHPSFDEYPLVGVSYEQAEAFCYWLTNELKTKAKLGFEPKVTLPSEREWFYAAYTENGLLRESVKYLWDNSYLTDLRLENNPSRDDFDQRLSDVLRADVSPVNEEGILDFMSDGYLYTHPYQRKELAGKGIVGLADNVSEWLRERNDLHFQAWYQQYRESLWQSREQNYQLQRGILEYYLQFSDDKGNLIRGGNWLDERPATINGLPAAALRLKCFKNANRSFATVGFRYVIHIE